MKYITYINKVITGFILLSVLFSFVSCNEDLGNYNYTDVNAIIISNIEDEYDVTLGGNFNIQPQLTFTLGYEDECSYQWLFLKTNEEGSTEPYLIATTKDLQEPVSGEVGRMGSGFIYYYIVKNEVTEVEYIRKFLVNVTTEINSGYLILNDISGHTRLDMLSYYNSEFTLYTDFTEMVGGNMPTDGRPIQVVTYVDANAPYLSAPAAQGQFGVVILTDKGTYRLHPYTFEYSEAYSMSYLILSDDPELFPNGHILEKLVSSTGSEAYTYVNNNWFYYNNGTRVLFNQPINYMKGSYTRYNPAPYVISGGGKSVLFNIDDQSFVTHSRAQWPYVEDGAYSSYITAEDKFFPYRNIDQKNLELIYMGQRGEYITTSSSSGRGIIIFRNKVTGTYWVSQILQSTQEQLTFDEIVGESFANANFYEYNPEDGSSGSDFRFLYYATDTEIYLLELLNNAGNKMTPKLVWEAPAGHKISFMKYLYTGPSSSNPLDTNWKNLLVVATYDPNDTQGTEGTLQFLKSVEKVGTLYVAKDDADNDRSYKGFGKIVSVAAKYK